ncbi:phosphomevalonate kinase [Streptococcus dysgalactiae subsp. equisimilis]|nr:phosphomevalonate kinase [Streptococcus dysgalactiae subsp. equisimilis]
MITAEIGPSSHLQLASDMFDHKADMTPDASYGLIQATIKTFAKLYGAVGGTIRPLFIVYYRQTRAGWQKFGIGSSGSVTLLTLKALSAYYQQPLSPELLFKLAAYTLLVQGDNGSMGDIACIAYQTLVAYTSFDRQQVSQWLSDMPLRDLLAKDWGYQIQVIETSFVV